MVATPPAEGETLREIADRYGRSHATIANVWSQHPDWPAHVGKRGRAYVYDPAKVDKVVEEHFMRPLPFEPRRLYTARQIAELTGITAGTIRADVSKGRWPAPDDTEGPANRWRGATVTAALAGRQVYRRSTS
ncbi:hypothetical protein ACIOHA_15775 [Streptomyces anulatus]